jgi:hypothetical protein
MERPCFVGGPPVEVCGASGEAIQSFRLRLHSGLRQSGNAIGAAFCGTAEQAAEKVGFRAESGEKRVPGTKARIDSAPVMPGLNSRPISETNFSAACEAVPFRTGAHAKWVAAVPTSQNRDVGHPAGYERGSGAGGGESAGETDQGSGRDYSGDGGDGGANAGDAECEGFSGGDERGEGAVSGLGKTPPMR